MNVVPVSSMTEAARHANVVTQTVGVFPASRKREVRDLLATAGVQRVMVLGNCHGGSAGNPHDGMYPLHRFMNWVCDDDTETVGRVGERHGSAVGADRRLNTWPRARVTTGILATPHR